jgi:hypothetical protein
MTAARPNLYKAIHKGLRLGHCQILQRLGTADWLDQKATSTLLGDLRVHLVLCREHLDHEDASMHPSLAEKAPDVHEMLEHDHANHLASFDRLKAHIALVAVAADNERPALGDQLYLMFSHFMAEDFRHMEREETEAMAAMWHHMTDAELMEVHSRILAGIPPMRMIDYMRLILPAVDPHERLMMLQGMQESAPEPAFLQVLEQAARPTLPAREWQSLIDRLGVAA